MTLTIKQLSGFLPARPLKFTLLVFSLALLWGCNSSSDSGSDDTEKRPGVVVTPSDEPVIFGAGGNVARLLKNGGYANPSRLDANATSIAYHKDLYWVSTEKGTLYALAEINDKENSENLKTEKQFKLNYKDIKLLDFDDRLFISAKDLQSANQYIIELDAESGLELKKVTTNDQAMNHIQRILHHKNHLYFINSGTFMVGRVDVKSFDVQKLDLRPSSEGKAGTGDMAMADGKLWVLDRSNKTFIKINPDNLSIESNLSFQEAGVDIEIDNCIAGKDYLYCWAGQNLVVLNIKTGKKEAGFNDVSTIYNLTPFNNTLYVGTTGTIHFLDEKSLAVKQQIDNQQVRDFMVMPPR